MTQEVEFEVESGGAPKLEGTPEGGGRGDPAPSSGGVLEPQLAESWTAAEASALVSGVYNVGVLVYGPRWASHPAEFPAAGATLPAQLDRYLPKAPGGGVALLGLGLLAVGGELIGATARRWPLIQQGPRPIWQQQPAGKPPAEPAPAPPPAEANGAAEPPAPGSYKLPKDLLRVVTREEGQEWMGLA